jgi:hypothetical protein
MTDLMVSSLTDEDRNSELTYKLIAVGLIRIAPAFSV